MADVLEQIESVSRQADADLSAVKNAAELEQFRIKYLGSKGQIKGLMKLLGQVPKEQKPAIGQKVNALQDRVSVAFESRKTHLAAGLPAGVSERTPPARQTPSDCQPPHPHAR